MDLLQVDRVAVGTESTELGHLADAYLELVAERDKLQTRLADRQITERAKGILMSRHRWTEQTAFRNLQRAAMSRRVPMADLAQQVINGTDGIGADRSVAGRNLAAAWGGARGSEA